MKNKVRVWLTFLRYRSGLMPPSSGHHLEPFIPNPDGLGVDLVLVGGGLANLLLAWRIADLRPGTSFLLLEQGPTLGGNHTWSYHGTDLDPASRAWVGRLARRSWLGSEVRFPLFTRQLVGSYHSVDSADLAARAIHRFGNRILVNATVRSITPSTVELDGRVMEAGAVIDGRGWDQTIPMAVGYQRFFGLELRLTAPHGLTTPLLMDATVPQEGGYRFIYVLPFGPDVVLVEDTVYEDQPAPDETRSRRAIERYVAGRGWTVDSELRQERGALPIPLAGRFDDFRMHQVAGVPTIGVRAGLMHPTTGYSLPYAVRTAEVIATAPTLTSAALEGPVAALARATFERQWFLRLLNRLLFRAADPPERYRVLQKFYRLPEPTIARFYGDRLTMIDKVRLLTGRPPLSVRRALHSLAERIDR